MADRPSREPSRTEQRADPADVRAVGYGPDEPVRVPERYADLPVHKEDSGSAGHWNDRLMAPEPSSVYLVDDRYLYATDAAGRVTHAEGWLGWLPSKDNDEHRNHAAQREAGEPDRLQTDDGGHLFATAFDGPGEAINLTAQSQTQNRAVTGSDNWRRMEETWRAIRAAGIQVHATIDVRHPDSTSRRPSSRAVVAHHQGVRSPRRIFKETKPTSPRER